MKTQEEINREFNHFKKRVVFWKDKLGLADWELSLIEQRDVLRGENHIAICNTDLEQKQAWIYFYGDLEDGYDIDTIALHEVLHIFLADTKADNQTQHGIIHRLIPLLKQ